MAHTYGHLYNLPTTGLRFFTAYGPWDRPDMALFKFTKAIINDEAIDVYNHEKMSCDFTYVDDIVEAVSRLVNKPATPNPEWTGSDPDPSSSSAPYKIYNIGNNSPVRLMEFVEAIENKLGKIAKKITWTCSLGMYQKFMQMLMIYIEILTLNQKQLYKMVWISFDWYLEYY